MKTKREKEVVKTSIISIGANIVLVIFKMIVGLLSNSIAIVSDAINNLTDVLSSIITIIGTKLSNKKPDKEHPYGHGRGEYMTSLAVSIIVIYAGVTALNESIKKIIHPTPVEYTIFTIIVLVMAIVIKCTLGTYVKKKGKQVNSDSLYASGTDALNDAILSTSVLFSVIVYFMFNINLEAYIGVMISIMIIKTGWELIKEAIDNILGKRIESSLAQEIKKEITKEENVKGAFDLIVHNYGPDTYLGSIHIEVPDSLNAAEIDKLSRRITKNIRNKYGVILHTIGIYSINENNNKVFKEIKDIVFSYKGILQLHGFYIDEEEKTISFDIIIDFKVEDKEDLYRKIYDEIKSIYKDYKIQITLDIDTSD